MMIFDTFMFGIALNCSCKTFIIIILNVNAAFLIFYKVWKFNKYRIENADKKKEYRIKNADKIKEYERNYRIKMKLKKANSESLGLNS